MFTGIVECIGTVVSIEKSRTNIDFQIESAISQELKIDQSVSHDGVCLTVTKISGNIHSVTAVSETLNRTNLSQWQNGTTVNMERCLKADGRFDGHIVQGHIDGIGIVSKIEDLNGSYKLHFKHKADAGITVEKGSICINGISLTVVDSSLEEFSVVIIPYTWEHTNIGRLKPNEQVNLEFDIVGKYLQKIMHK
jgi:riboflavin synthase